MLQRINLIKIENQPKWEDTAIIIPILSTAWLIFCICSFSYLRTKITKIQGLNMILRKRNKTSSPYLYNTVFCIVRNDNLSPGYTFPTLEHQPFQKNYLHAVFGLLSPTFYFSNGIKAQSITTPISFTAAPLSEKNGRRLNRMKHLE